MTHVNTRHPSPSPVASPGPSCSKAACWIEAMRLRTLPVSLSGIIAATALALHYNTFLPVPVVICFIFATLAQIASNFANEYFDFRDGLDKKGRIGPRRGVTEGDIPPGAMLRATFITLALAAATGCTLIVWGGWWLIAAGAAIILGALAYSAGPWPLSRHGLGEVAVIIFFGVAPVTLTYWLQAGNCPWQVWLTSVAIGLIGANVLIVNNYRDREDDAAAGKRTLAVIFGERFASTLYLLNAIVAVALMTPVWLEMTDVAIPAVYIYANTGMWRELRKSPKNELTGLLAKTSVLMLAYTVLFLISAII